MLGRIISLVFLWCLLICPYSCAARSPKNKATTSCGLTRLKAKAQIKELASPGYPGLFADQTQCTWLIEAPENFRIKIRVRDMALKRDSSCMRQFVVFTDALNGMRIGPLCGKDNPGEIVSAGKLVKVKLESNSVGYNSKYRGFKLTYTQTKDDTSIKLRDQAGLWKKYMVPEIPLTTPPKPTDNVVDINNNNEINKKNEDINAQNKKMAQELEANNYVPVTETLPPPTQRKQPIIKPTLPGRWVPPPRMKKRPMHNTQKTVAPLPTPYRPPPRRNVNHFEPIDDSGNSQAAAKYAGIVAGVILIIIIALLIGYKIKLERLKKDKSGENPSVANSVVLPTISKEFPFSSRKYEFVRPIALANQAETKFEIEKSWTMERPSKKNNINRDLTHPPIELIATNYYGDINSNETKQRNGRRESREKKSHRNHSEKRNSHQKKHDRKSSSRKKKRKSEESDDVSVEEINHRHIRPARDEKNKRKKRREAETRIEKKRDAKRRREKGGRDKSRSRKPPKRSSEEDDVRHRSKERRRDDRKKEHKTRRHHRSIEKKNCETRRKSSSRKK